MGEFEVDVRFFAHGDGSEHIVRQLKFDQALDEALASKVLDICQKTPVTKTLLRAVSIETSLLDALSIEDGDSIHPK